MVYVFELKEMLDALIDSVAGREGVQEMACEMAQAGCYGAVEKLRMTEGWYTDEEKREILEKTLRSLAPTFFLLDATPEIKDTQDISIQKKYEACMCLLNEINTLAITRGFSFQALGVHFAHPLVEDMGNNMEQIAKLLEITHKQIIIETDKTDEIKHQLGECLIHIDNALKGLDNFLVNQNAADALEIKQRLVNQLVGELEVLHPKELMKSKRLVMTARLLTNVGKVIISSQIPAC